MASLPELNEYTAGVYQIETSDPVLGGVDGITNVPLKALANRTKWLKEQVDALVAAVGDAISDADLTAAINKLPFKAPVAVATTTNITLSGLQTIDGVSLTAGQRVLVVAQSTAAQNGIYTAQTSAWVRADDMNEDAEIQAGVQVMVAGGTIYADTIWHLLTDGTITIGTTAQTWKCLTNNTALLGSPTAPTPAQFDADTSIATTAFVQAALGNYQGAYTLSGSITVPASDAGKCIIWGDATNITATLPSFASCPVGARFMFLNTGTGNLTVQRAGTDTIDNGPSAVTSVVASPNTSLELVKAAGTSLWQVVTGGVFGSGLGYGQTWQDVSASRVTGTTYYNTTGKPIVISISIGTSVNASLNVSGVVASWADNSTVNRSVVTAIVPPGASYSLSGAYQSGRWSELR